MLGLLCVKRTALWLFLLTFGRMGYGWTGAQSPLEEGHLVLLWADGFRNKEGRPVAVQKDSSCVGGSGWRIPQGEEAVHDLRIRHGGEYVVWVRLGSPPQPPYAPVQIEIKNRDGNPRLRGQIHDGEGSAERGGPKGLSLFVSRCVAQTPGGEALARVRGYSIESSEAPLRGQTAAEGLEDLVAELKRDMATGEEAGGANRYRDAQRLDPFNRGRPYYWWKVGRLVLEPGVHRVDVRRANESEGKDPLLDVVLLSTATDDQLEYPVAGDITRQPGSYVRFRIDALPPEGFLSIRAGMKTHYDPFSAGPWLFNPEGFPTASEGSKPHTQVGYTRWYRLQDSGGEKAPGYGGSEVRFDIQLSPSQSRGATQFAGYPHADYLVREIEWQEPDGCFISMRMNFDQTPEHLRTIRDHSRENYDRALRATGGRLFPLTPTDHQTFGNAAGGGFGAAQDYEFKVLRLLGFNVPSVSDGLVYRRLYGGDLAGGHYWPPVYMPYDEEEARLRYWNHYQNAKGLFSPYTRIFQLADEPGEIDANFSAPLWRYRKEGGTEWLQDESGGSEWVSRQTNLSYYVLEGEIQGESLTIRIGYNPTAPEAPHGFWTVGQVTRLTPANLRFGIGPAQNPGQATLAVCQIDGSRKTAFRIVHEGSRAQLFVQEQPTAAIENVPSRGAVSIAMGGRGRVYRLGFRPLRHAERMARPPSGSGADVGKRGDDLEGLFEDLMDGMTGEEARADLKMGLQEQIARHWVAAGGNSQAQEGFRRWLQARGVSPDLFGVAGWQDVRMMKVRSLVETPAQKRLYYWSRRYSGWLTPRMFALAAEAAHAAAPNPKMESFVALSGHALYMGSTAMPLDMFELARWGESTHLLAGVSDAMTLASWRWDSHQSVAYSVAPYNAGGRVIGRPRRNFPMMYCHWPNEMKLYTMLGNQCKAISLFWYGPQWAITEWYWADNEGSYHAASKLANRTALAADIVGPGTMRPSNVALLYAHSTEYWSGGSSYADKRALFMALAHEYYQPELVTEEQIVLENALDQYRALYLVEPHVQRAATEKIVEWVRRGGLLWVCADAWRFDEYDEPNDGLHELAGVERIFTNGAVSANLVQPIAERADFLPHRVEMRAVANVRWPGSVVRAEYEDGSPAWMEGRAGKGWVVYVGHRGGRTYSRRAIVLGGRHDVWMEAPRRVIVSPLFEKGVEREMAVSHPAVVAYPLTASNGTAIVLFNSNPYPIECLEFQLKEAQRPLSVMRFVDQFDLESLSYDWLEGQLRFVLPRLGENESQMVIIRTAENREDRRVEEMEKHVKELIGEEDWRARSAGVWMAGFFSGWGLERAIRERLEDPHYAVRRAAAESLGRLRFAPAAGDLRRQIERESDSHALSEMLMALARVGSAEDALVITNYRLHRDVIVVRGALLGLREAIRHARGEIGERLKAAAEDVAWDALGNWDARVFEPALQLLGDVNPDRCLRAVMSPESEGIENPRSTEWLDHVSRRSDVFEAWLRAGMPDRERLAFRWAAWHVHPALVETLLNNPEQINAAGLFLGWTNPSDAMRLFERRERLPKNIQPYVLILLTRVFQAHLGNEPETWAKYFERAEIR